MSSFGRPERHAVTWRARKVAGRHGRIATREYTPSGLRPDAEVIVWVHGGGFIAGGLWMAESHQVGLALAATGRTVVAVDYHKVPFWPVVFGGFPVRPHRNNFPVPVEDVLDAYQDTARRFPDRRLFLGGASAGAHLAAAVSARAADRPPAGLLLCYGVFHAELPPASAEVRAATETAKSWFAFRPAHVRRMSLNYVGTERRLARPELFPGTAAVDQVPPTLFVDAEFDSLRPSALAYAARLRAAGVAVRHEVVTGAGHGFLGHQNRSWRHEAIGLVSGWLGERQPGAEVGRRPLPV